MSFSNKPSGGTVIWVHMDALSMDHPVFSAAPDARAVFIWDADDLARRGWTLKRCVFLMECVEAMGVELLQGPTEPVLRDLAPEQLFYAKTTDPALKAVVNALDMETTAVAPLPFTDVPRDTDMGRFFRFWNKARRSAMSPTRDMSQPMLAFGAKDGSQDA